MKLYQIRCYGKYYDPDAFKSHGWRGWWIRVLNRVRFWIECRVVWNVLRIEAQRAGDLADLAAIRDHFETDVQNDRTHFTQERPRMAPASNATIDGHLAEMHQKGSVLTEREHTAQVLNRLAADARSKRYTVARGRRVIMEAETHQETQNVENTVQPLSRSESPRQTRSGATGKVRPIHPEYAAENPVDFDGFISSETQDPLAAERLAAGNHIQESAEAAAEAHQRSILSTVESTGEKRPHRGSDERRQDGPPDDRATNTFGPEGRSAGRTE